MAASMIAESHCYAAFIKFAEHDTSEFLCITNSWSHFDSRTDAFNAKTSPDQYCQSLSIMTDLEDQTAKAATYGKLRLVCIAIGAIVVCFTVGLDDTIIATALPTISAEFSSFSQISWYGSLYYLPQAVLQPFYGKMYAVFSPKIVYLGALTIFEIGSLISARAINSPMLIAGRAISGIGASGTIVGGFYILNKYFSPRTQTLLVGIVTVVLGMFILEGLPWVFGTSFIDQYQYLAFSSALGPLFGGIITEYSSWRWCFGINIPIGGTVSAMLCVCLQNDDKKVSRLDNSWKGKLVHLDLFGTCLFSMSIICLLSGLQLIGNQQPSVASIAALFITASVTALILTLQQKYRKAEGLIPICIIKKRNVWAVAGLLFFSFAAFANHVYFLPLYFQTILGLSPISSAARTLPYMVSISATALLTVMAMKYATYVNPFIIGGSALLCIASGLITKLGMTSSLAQIILYQILAGGGLGFCILAITICPQRVLLEEDLPRAQGVIAMIQILGQTLSTQLTTIFLSTSLRRNLVSFQLPQATINTLISNPRSLQVVTDQSVLQEILSLFESAFQSSFKVGIFVAVISFGFAWCLQWKRVTVPTQKSDIT